MLIIRDEQWGLLQTGATANFEQRLAAAMETLFPEEAARLRGATGKAANRPGSAGADPEDAFGDADAGSDAVDDPGDDSSAANSRAADGFRRYLDKGLRGAAASGCEYEDDFAIFVALMLINRQLRRGEIGNDPKFLSWVRHILNRKTTPGHIKTRLIEQRLRRQAGKYPLAGAICLTFADLRKQF